MHGLQGCEVLVAPSVWCTAGEAGLPTVVLVLLHALHTNAGACMYVQEPQPAEAGMSGSSHLQSAGGGCACEFRLHGKPLDTCWGV